MYSFNRVRSWWRPWTFSESTILSLRICRTVVIADLRQHWMQGQPADGEASDHHGEPPPVRRRQSHPRRDRRRKRRLHGVVSAIGPGPVTPPAPAAAAQSSNCALQTSQRWWMEPQLRDTKDSRFGMGLSATRIGEPMRRDRLLLVSAFATALLTLLGAVGESLGMDRLLKPNTSSKRTHSLFRQGCMLYDLIPNMPEQRLTP